MSLWATKSVTALRAEAEATGEQSLKRTLGALNLTMLGIGAIIGAGIFVLTGLAAAPARRTRRAALVHRRRRSPAPSPASATPRWPARCRSRAAPTPTRYATMGEFVAWIIGWDLVLEYAMGAATVGGRLVRLLRELARLLRHPHPAALTSAPLRFCTAPDVAQRRGRLCPPGLEPDRLALQPAGDAHRRSWPRSCSSIGIRSRPRSTT